MLETTNDLDRLQKLIRGLFGFDSDDLDFGIYRILKQKRGPIDDFLQIRLPQLVEETFAVREKIDKATLSHQVAELEVEIKGSLGPDAIDDAGALRTHFRNIPLGTRYLSLRSELANAQVREDARSAVYGYLFTFFSRYYDAGDFVSKRRYSRKEPYVISYSGEETLLFWANRDQYYAKASSRFGTYRFVAENYAIVFTLKNERTVDDGKRFLILAAGEESVIYDEPTKTFSALFGYRLLTTAEKEIHGKASRETIQSAFLDAAAQTLSSGLDDKNLLAQLSRRADDEGNTVLRSHLNRFAKKNAADFFVHRDLKQFLSRELDFFLKNEVLDLNEIAGGNGKGNLQCAACVRSVGNALIDLLHQIEDLKKTLFEKKKFILTTHYCVTIDKIPSTLWDEVLSNKAQLEEWKLLFSAPVIVGADGGPKLERAFLDSHPALMVDTVHFGDEFKWRLLETIDNLSDSTNGLLFKGDSFQALNLISSAYKAKIKCVYVAPPYNHSDDDFLYKDGYRHSSWLTMMRDRALIVRQILQDDGVFFVSLDDNEAFRAQLMLRDCFGIDNFLCGAIAWEKRYSPPPDTDDIGYVHELILCFKATPEFRRNLLPLADEQTARYVNPDGDLRGPWKSMDYTCRYTAEERPNLYYAIHHPYADVEVWPKKTRVWAYSPDEHKKNERDNRIWWGKKGTAKVPAYKNFISEIEQGKMPMTLLPHELVGHTDEAAKELRDLFPGAKANVKPTRLIMHLATIGANSDSIIADYFGGSGTTAHAVLALNRADGGSRKYILVENDEEFYTRLLPRIKKVVFGEDWQDGTSKGLKPISHLLQYHTVEQYEDALTNIEFVRSREGQQVFSLLQDPYLLTYMLSFEAQGSRAMLNLEGFGDPFEYKYFLESGAAREVKIDLIETFNFLIGLDVKRVLQIRDDAARLYRAVAGYRDGQQIAVIWRRSSDMNGNVQILESDNKFITQHLIPTLWGNEQPDQVFVNSPSFVKGAQPIEAEFKRRMFSSAPADDRKTAV